MAVSDVIFAGSMSWAAVVIVLLGEIGAANVLEDPAVMTSRFDSVFWGEGPLAFLCL